MKLAWIRLVVRAHNAGRAFGLPTPRDTWHGNPRPPNISAYLPLFYAPISRRVQGKNEIDFKILEKTWGRLSGVLVQLILQVVFKVCSKYDRRSSWLGFLPTWTYLHSIPSSRGGKKGSPWRFPIVKKKVSTNASTNIIGRFLSGPKTNMYLLIWHRITTMSQSYRSVKIFIATMRRRNRF